MRILWIKIGGLWPPHTGGRLRSFHILSELSRRHEVTVITTRSADESPELLAEHLPHCQRVISLPHNAPKHGSTAFVKALLLSWFTPLPVDLYKNQVAAMAGTVVELLQQDDFDFCIADFLTAFPNVPRKLSLPVIQFSHNVEYMIWQRLCDNAGSWLRRLLLQLEWRKLRRYEKAACERAELTIAVSENDRQQLLKLSPASRIVAVPTGVDIEYFRPGPASAERPLELVFSGSMDWFPNEDAMVWFIESMLPLIRNKLPSVTLTIVGRNPGQRIRQLAGSAGIKVTGTVEDVRPSVERAAVYVVPLRIGGGTRLKIFEALAMGKAIVSTTIGAEGLPLQDGKHILLADTPEAFADKVLALLKHPAARTSLGQAGRQLVAARYSWCRVTNDFEALCRTAGKSTTTQSILPRGYES